jgi:hypothetical protein
MSLAAPSLTIKQEVESAAPSPPMDTETPLDGTMETQPPMDTAMETQAPVENTAMETESPMKNNTTTVPPTLPPPVHDEEDWSNSTETPLDWGDGSDFPSYSPSMPSTTTDAPSFSLALEDLDNLPTPSPPLWQDNETMVPIDEVMDSPPLASPTSCQIDVDLEEHEILLLQTVINVPIYVPAPESKRAQRNSYVSIVCTLPNHGDLTLQSNGTIAYHPQTSYVGTDEFWILRCPRNGNGSFSSSSASASSASNESGSFSSASSMSRSGSNGNHADCRVQQYSVTVVATAASEAMRTRDSDSSSPRLRRRRFWTSTGIMALVFGLAVAVIVLACLLAFCCHRERTKSLLVQQAATAAGNSSDSTNPTDPSSTPPLSPLAAAPAAETAVTATATAAAVRHSVLWDRFSGIGQRLFRPVVTTEPGLQPLPVFKDQTRHCTASADMMAVIPNRLRRARPEASLGEGRPEFPPYRATTPSSLTTPTVMRSDRSDPPCDKEFRALTDKDDLASANNMPMVTAVAMSETEDCTNEDGEDEYMF